MRYHSPDPADGNGGEPAAKPAKETFSVPIVQKTPNRSPREVVLEKKLSTLEDELSGLKSWRDDVNTFMANFLPSKPKAAALAPEAKVANLPKEATFLEGLADDILG